MALGAAVPRWTAPLQHSGLGMSARRSSVVIRVLFACAFALSALNACVAPSQHDEKKWGSLSVALGPSLAEGLAWRPDQAAEIQKALDAAEALGPAFPLVSEADAQMVIRPFFSKGPCTPGMQVGRFAPGTHFVECNPDCAQGYMELRTCVIHELGHLLGMGHVCLEHREVADCSPVGYGYAVMNPQIAYGDAFDDMSVSVSTDRPTDLDLAEYRRTRH